MNKLNKLNKPKNIYKVVLEVFQNGLIWECYTTSITKAINQAEKYANEIFDFSYELVEVEIIEKRISSLYEEITKIEINNIEEQRTDGKFIVYRINVQ